MRFQKANVDLARDIDDLSVLENMLPDGWVLVYVEARPGKGQAAYRVYKDKVKWTQKQSSNFANVYFWSWAWEEGLVRHPRDKARQS